MSVVVHEMKLQIRVVGEDSMVNVNMTQALL